MIHINKFSFSVLLCVFVLLAHNGYGCSCKYFSDTDNLENRILESNKVFSGTVIKNEFVKDSNLLFKIESRLIKTTFLIVGMYKGVVYADTISIYQLDSNCLFPFKLNEKYLVYSHLENGKESTDKCTPTVAMEEAKVHLTLLEKMRRRKRI